MPQKRFICLANSRKDGDRCLAGIDSDGNWVRLVNKGGHALTLKDIKDEQGNQPELLETWEVEVLSQEPLYFQPENWVIDDDVYWECLDRDIYPDLDGFCDNDKYIFFNSSD